MKILLSWLHEHLPIQPNGEEVKKALTSVGIEVASSKNLSEGLEKVVVGKILTRAKHPDADRLSLCRVSDGIHEFSIVCGANNMKENDHVALAYIGATLPNGVTLKKTKIRGVESEGMLCSEKELGFSEESEGILILSPDTPVGMPLAEALKRNDTLLEVEISPNRGDCLSVIGIAREVAAAFSVQPKIPFSSGDGPKDSRVNAFVHDSMGCPRYVLHLITDLNPSASSERIMRRLSASGVRSINNIVDVTNYIMLEWGQPMHAFDQSKVVGNIQVRRAKAGEKIVCLDEVERELKPEDLVIADEEGPVAIAGVMGGLRTAVTDQTKAILLESACFDPTTVRLTAKRLALHTESSHRFERSVDVEMTWAASIKAVELLEKSANGHLFGSIDLRGRSKTVNKITLRKTTLDRILGEDIKKAGEYLVRLGLRADKLDAGWVVEIPAYRSDLTREIDLVEEVSRMHGYNQFASVIPPVAVEPEINHEYFEIDRIRDLLSSAGIQEVKNYSFESKQEIQAFPSQGEPVKVLNPISEESDWMRTSLIPGLLRNWKFNQARQVKGIRLFEVGKTFLRDQEELRLTILFANEFNWQTLFRKPRLADFFDGKGVVEFLFDHLMLSGYSFEPSRNSTIFHPGKSSQVVFRKKEIGMVGVLHPGLIKDFDLKGSVVVADLSLAPLMEAGQRSIRYKPLSPFPSAEKDLAFFMKKEVSAAQLIQEVKKLREPLIQSVDVFDFYMGKGVPEGEVSIAIRMNLSSPDRTLTDEEVDTLLKKVVAHVQMTCSARLRGEL